MITGSVNSYHEAIIQLSVLGISGKSIDIQAVIDTGFSGSLTLPETIIAELNLPFWGLEHAILGDGSIRTLEKYGGIVGWDSGPVRIPIDSANTTPLAGTAFLDGHNLTIEAIAGGAVTISRL